MDAIDILGGLLGHKSSRPGKGTDILTDILRRGARAQPRSRPASSGSPQPRPGDIGSEAQALEDLLNVANDRSSRRRTGQAPPSRPQPPSRPDDGFRQPSPTPSHGSSYSDRQPRDANLEDERALVLVRAMLSAAKSDGQIDQSEQQNILERMGDTSRDTIQFLREEFAKPLDIRGFIRSVPVGMEQQVYTLSLIAIDLDTGREADYLLELAEGLRIPAEVREQIHQRLGAPSIY